MAQSPSPLHNDIYRLALIDPHSRRCLTNNKARLARLPRIAIPKWTRAAAEISRVILDSWGLKAVVLDIFANLGGDSGCVLAELFGPEQGPRSASRNTWCCTADLAEDQLSRTERDVVENLVATGSTGRGAFSRLGWLDDAVTWIRSEQSEREFHFSGEFAQLNGNASFCLIRLGNSRGRAYWLKAVGEPNLSEFPVTMALARRCSKYIPNIVAARRDWNAWVMKDAGHPIHEPLVVSQLELVTITLANFQKASMEYEQELHASGCYDQRASILRLHIPALIDYLIDSMAKQTSTNAPKVRELRLREIGKLLLDACTQLEALKIPVTIIHNDFTLENVLIRGSRCVFTDWAEAGLGNPLMTYEHLCACIAGNDRSATWLSELDHLYKRSWSDVLSESHLNRALVLSPLVAIASYLLGRANWLGSSRAQDFHFQRHARGLARHMDRAAAAPEFLEALCP
jgi:hypothetical protein